MSEPVTQPGSATASLDDRRSDARRSGDSDAVVERLRNRLRGQRTVRPAGRLVRAVGTSLRVSGLPVRIGQRCEIVDPTTDHGVQAEVVGLDGRDAILLPLGALEGIALDSEVRILDDAAIIRVDQALLGRVLDGFGQPLDDQPPVARGRAMSLTGHAPNPLSRQRIDRRLTTGIRVIDALLTVGIGQRLGIFAPAGAGKSTLLGMLAGLADVDVIVVGLIGERGREVREFLDDTLDDRVRERTVVVVATSDRPAMERISAAHTAVAIAEGFRAEGKHVLLLVDSVTRFARAVREVGLAVGEPPVRQGFTPSVFAELPRLFERGGNSADGCMTSFFTILTDDEGGTDPVAEECRANLDGNIVLSRELAEKGHYPAVDVLASISRLALQLTDDQERARADRLRRLLARYQDVEFLIQVGEYQPGGDREADEAVSCRSEIERFLRQGLREQSALAETRERLERAITATSTPGSSAEPSLGSEGPSADKARVSSDKPPTVVSGASRQ